MTRLAQCFQIALASGVIVLAPCNIFSEENSNADQAANTTAQSGFDISQKNQLSETELKKKKEDGYFTFIGGPASSPDTGFGATGVVLYYYNGKKNDPLFAYTPYMHNIGFLASYQSRGYSSFAVMWDAPYFLGSPFRIYADLWFNTNPVSQFYGIGQETLGTLTDPAGKTYTQMDAYDSSLRSVANGNTNGYYNYYYSRWFDGKLMAQRDFGGGIFRVLAGYLIRNYTVSDYSGQKVFVNSGSSGNTLTPAVMGNTLLYNEYRAGNITGFNGGWVNAAMIGLTLDNRDLEPYPRKGMFHDIAFGYHSKWLGSGYDFSELTIGSRFYYSPFKGIDLVLVSRLAVSYKFGDVPFFALTTMQFTDQNLNSIGGVRGFRDRRFMGNFTTMADLEARYTFMSWKWGDQLFDLSVSPFLDMISVFDRPQKFSFNEWKIGYGAGLRLTWNQATVIRFDFGFSSEDFGFYLMIKQLY
ncbi:MAG: outer membrane protein assembly factor [Spirochaetia bacterium]|nr:outer membrane protein assembly factor [Spirochaetia bacterium]